MQIQGPIVSRLRTFFEILAAIGPIVCLVDCLVIPIVLVILPFVGIHRIYHGLGDQLVTAGVLAVCAPGLLSRYLRHKKTGVLVLAGIGFSLIFLANFAGNTIDETMHIAITVAGSLALIKANRDNKRLSQSCSCHLPTGAIPISIQNESDE